MALIPQSFLEEPICSSILLLGPPKRGKTISLATLHRVLRLRKLPTKMALFDFDDDGAEPFLRLARNGYESASDAIAKRNKIDPWVSDILLYGYQGATRVKDSIQPERKTSVFHEFIKDINELGETVNSQGQWIKNPLGAIIIDSITGLADITEDFVFGTRNKEISGVGTNAIDPGDWRLLGEKIQEVYKVCKSFPCYTVVIGHVELRQEIIRGNISMSKGEPSIQPIATHQIYDVPLVPGQLRDRIAKDFSVVLYATEDFRWRTRPGERIRSAGSRGKDNLSPEVDQDFKEVLDI